MVSFDGGSSLTYRPGAGPRPASEEVISLKFKSLKNSGTLLHAEGHEGLSLSLELKGGKLLLQIKQGTAHRHARL